MSISGPSWSWRTGLGLKSPETTAGKCLMGTHTCVVSAPTSWIQDLPGLATLASEPRWYRKDRQQKKIIIGWHVVELSSKYLELDDPFRPIPDLESYAQGEDVIVLTILSERDEALAHFGGLLDVGGYAMEEPYELESPYQGEAEDVLPIEDQPIS